MITIKTPQDIIKLREGGSRLAYILRELGKAIVPGISTLDLENLALKLVKEGGDKAAFLNYRPHGAKRPFPAALCVSVNDAVVHGIPNEQPYILKEGDIVSLDMGLLHDGLYTDSAITVGVGKIDKKAEQLLDVTKRSLELGIQAAQGGSTTGDIGFAVARYAMQFGFGIVKELCGHGVGHKIHEDPFVPNYGNRGEGDKLRPGMVIAIEPMLNEGTEEIILDADGYTYRTSDGKRSAHFEHTI
ncbi:MAG: type I methionyl aminopeptidase, partial [Candidatus Paceibacterota bacterium]